MQKGSTKISDLDPVRTGKNYLLIIAIDKYQDKRFPALRNCKKDANQIKSLLLEKYNFKKEDIFELTDEEATSKSILRAFKCLREKITENDNLVFIFSGHGKYDKEIDRGYWITFKTESDDESTYLHNIRVKDQINSLSARHIFGIIDSCFSASLFRGEFSGLGRRYQIPSRWLLTAGRIEPVEDGANGQNSPFAKAIIQKLENHSEDILWVSDLCSWVNKVVEFNASQTPRGEPLPGVGHQGGEFAFLKPGINPPMYSQEVDPFQVISKGEKNLKRWPFAVGIVLLLIVLLASWFLEQGNDKPEDNIIRSLALEKTKNDATEFSESQSVIYRNLDSLQKFLLQFDGHQVPLLDSLETARYRSGTFSPEATLSDTIHNQIIDSLFYYSILGEGNTLPDSFSAYARRYMRMNFVKERKPLPPEPIYIKGKIIDCSNNGITGQKISLQSSQINAVSDEDGIFQFKFQQPPPKSIKLIYAKSRSLRDTLAINIARYSEGQPIILNYRNYELKGSIFLNGQPFAFKKVLLTNNNISTTTDGDGRYIFSVCIPDTRYMIEFGDSLSADIYVGKDERIQVRR